MIDLQNGPETTFRSHLRDVGLTEEEIEAGRAIIPSGFATMVRIGVRPTAEEFRALIAPKPGARATRMAAHPLADLFPVMPFKDLEALAEDIKRNGQHDPIITFEGKLLDGRHRFQACQMAGVEPNFEEFTGTDPVAFVISKNLHRRHLTSSQRAVIANEMAQLPRGNPQLQPNVVITTISQSQAAELMDVSRDQVAKARRVAKEAPELVEPIRHGEMSINAALEKIKPVKAEPVTATSAEENTRSTTPTTARERLLASATSPADVQKIVAAAAEVTSLRDRAVAIAEILEDFPDRALRRKLMDHLVQQFRAA
jgi:ParB-like chromosome segregation protein Spo0J